MLEVGTKAPDFTLPDKEGKMVSLSDFAGKRVVLYFYPKDNTPGCTRQACAFAGAYEEFKTLDAVVIGVSKDSVASHQKFAEKYDLPFVLLSDPELTAIQAYGVWQEKKLYGKVSMGVVRSTYVIDKNGVIEKVMPKVKPDTNAAEILDYGIHVAKLAGIPTPVIERANVILELLEKAADAPRDAIASLPRNTVKARRKKGREDESDDMIQLRLL